MSKRLRLWLYAILAVVPVTARAAVPLDDAAFTAFVQQKMQLYSTVPVTVAGPLAVAVAVAADNTVAISLHDLHDACVRAPAQCDAIVGGFVQHAAGTVLSSSPPAAAAITSAGPAPAAVPSDRAGFMAYVAGELRKLLPGAAVAIDGMTLNVTRPGGRAVPLDQRGYYEQCRQGGFGCARALQQSLQRTAAWLAPAQAAQLRASLHLLADCDSSPCKIAPSREPMAAFMRLAFANLAEVCFKEVGNGVVPMTNADRDDAGLDVDAALDLCARTTHDALGPLTAKPLPAGTIGAVEGPYAASRLLFAADWAALVQQSGGHLLVAAPQRDALYYMSGDDAAEIAALGARARSAYDAGLGIGSDVYRWNGGGWSLATAHSTAGAAPP